MAVVAVKQVFEDRQGTETEDGLTLTKSWLVTTSAAKDDDEWVVLQAAGIPRKGDKHPSTPSAIVTQRQAKPHARQPDKWTVVVTYTLSEETDDQNPGSPDTPNKPTIHFGWGTEQKVATKDKFGNPIRNSAGMPFRDPPALDHQYLTMTIKGTVSFGRFDPALLINYRDSVNSADFFGFGKDQVKLVDFGAETKLVGTRTMWDVNLQFHIKASWLLEILDAGRLESTTPVAPLSQSENVPFGVEKWRLILTEEGHPVNDDVPLDGKGQRLAKGQPFVFLKFAMLASKNFNDLLRDLGLPRTLSGYNVVP